MNFPSDLKYTDSHEWVRTEADGTLTIGISDAAQNMLGDLVFVGDAKVGETLSRGDTACVVESVKAASDVYIPVDGEITAFNGDLDTHPEQINSDPYAAWIFKVKPAAGATLEGLMDATTYEASVKAA
ncbi:MAG TPA: glycine cleavage system protein GcvH [Usitatibacteraceae bacterium]|nr:glycine cleavage system protein GcvH [Usitatibacteraceae bacterium]